ncbi:hypothetical protein XENOCAPTIV_011396 [Xenoophorus captivus]|uniref:Uncharacterized protein n=1 Tax=Xenoophorus captivus TaxID=1517983 RepID=A0ABV0RDF3_9TELE
MLTRNEQTSSNEQTVTPWPISETNGHSNMRINITACFTAGDKTFRLQVKTSAITLIWALPYAQKTTTVFFVWNPCTESRNCADKQWPFPSAAFCLHIQYRSRSEQLQEAFIMSLAGGRKSQYSKNKNGFETWGAFKYCTAGPNTTEMSS